MESRRNIDRTAVLNARSRCLCVATKPAASPFSMFSQGVSSALSGAKSLALVVQGAVVTSSRRSLVEV